MTAGQIDGATALLCLVASALVLVGLWIFGYFSKKNGEGK
jgi:hypothetical protein